MAVGWTPGSSEALEGDRCGAGIAARDELPGVRGWGQIVARSGDIALFRCGRCGFVSGEPHEKLLAENRYRTYYSSVPPPPPEARYGQWLAKAVGLVGRGRLLEVGAGSGR
jgi:hypothetical protein